MLHLRKVYSRDSNAFLRKDLSKAIMTRSRLRNKFLNKKTEENRTLCETKELLCFTFKKD